MSPALKPRPHRREPPRNLAVIALTSLASSTFAVLELVDVWVAAVEKKQCHAVVRPRAVGCSHLPLTLPGIPQSPNQPPTPPPPRTHRPRIHPRRQLKEVSAKAPLSALTHVKRVQRARRRRRLATRAAVRVLRRDPGRRRVAGAGEGPGGPVRARARANLGAGASARTRDQWEEWNALGHRVAEAQQPPGGPFGNPVRYGRDGDEAMDAKLYRRREGGAGRQTRPSSSTPPGRGRSSRRV